MKETEHREFKKSLAELKAGLVSIAAILNKHGRGELWFGIDNDGKVIGLDATEKTLRDVSQSIAAHIEPRIYPQVTQETVDDSTCIKIAFEGADKPYFAYGRAYMRVADEDRQLSVRELEKIIVDKNQDRLRWDNQPCNLSIDDLDNAKLQAFVERAGLKWDTPENAIDKLGLLRGRPTRQRRETVFHCRTHGTALRRIRNHRQRHDHRPARYEGRHPGTD